METALGYADSINELRLKIKLQSRHTDKQDFDIGGMSLEQKEEKKEEK
jgi:twitching motility protein PilU